MKKTALVICPGRGTYNKPELGYIAANLSQNNSAVLQQIDSVRAAIGCSAVSELDQMKLFKRALHLQPENAAALIYASGYLDFLAIDREQYDVVAITGNSMGWYTAMACAGSWSIDTSTRIVTHMAQLTADGDGAQFIYPLVDEQWQPSRKYHTAVDEQLARFPDELSMSINYGGYAVLAGTTKACQAAIKALPQVDDRFPLLLPNHAAFHTPMMQDASEQALQHWPSALFKAPQVPLVDGRGHIWSSQIVEPLALQQYTLGHQVTQCFDFSVAIQTAVKEFAPDHLILLGPGGALGGAVAQSLIEINWQDLSSKSDFTKRQQNPHPFVLSMGIANQRALVTGSQK